MIQDQVKLEEYRECKPYYFRIFKDGKIRIKCKYYHPSDVVILFSNGYLKNRRQMLIPINFVKVTVGGIESWGAKPTKQYFTISLGDIIATNDQSVKVYQIKKITELAQAKHPDNIPLGFTKTGRCKAAPTVGERFSLGKYWSTSVVTEILSTGSPFDFDNCVFQTLNSIYHVRVLNTI